MIAALKDPKVRTRINALSGVSRLEPALARKHLTIALDDAVPQVRAEAARFVGPFLPFDEFASDSKLALMAANDPSPFVRLHAVLQLHDDRSLKAIAPLLADTDPFLAGAALEGLGRPGKSDLLLPLLESKDARQRLGILLAIRRAQGPGARNRMPQFLADPDPAVRRAAIQWVAEDRLTEHKEAIAKSALKEPVTRELLEALLAAQQMLDADPKKPLAESSGEEQVVRIIKDGKQPIVFRQFVLKMLRPDHPALTINLLKAMFDSANGSGRLEVVRTLSMRADDPTQDWLRAIAVDDKLDQRLRAIAVVGLAQSASTSRGTRKALFALLEIQSLQRDVLRSLRGVNLDIDEKIALFTWFRELPNQKTSSIEGHRELADQLLLALRSGNVKDKDELLELSRIVGKQPVNDGELRTLLGGPGNAESGERVFYHLRGARCAVCHRIDGRGGLVGPDLSTIGKSLDRDKLIDSILTPSKEIAPAFTTWNVTMVDGKKHTGIILGENFDSTLTLADADGKRFTLKKLDIEDRQASTKSLMPEDLHRLMTRQEFRDLLEFLAPTKRE